MRVGLGFGFGYYCEEGEERVTRPDRLRKFKGEEEEERMGKLFGTFL